MRFAKLFPFLFLFLLSFNIHAQKSTDAIDAVPAWAAGAVWYRIEPERFSNGDTKNDPTRLSLYGAWPHDTSYTNWHTSPWTSDWYALQPWEKANGKGIWYNLAQRRYGGDIQGIINKLGYLDSLGVNAIFLNSVFYAPSDDKTDPYDFHHIDPYFGPDPKGDISLIQRENPSDPTTWAWTEADKLFLTLVNEVHKRNMHIIMNVAWDKLNYYSPFMQDVSKNKQESKYKNWFEITDWKKKGGLDTSFTYKAYMDVADFPLLRQNDEVKKYIWACTQRWMAPRGDVKQGIDGWRCDAAYDLSHGFWKDWRKSVRTTNPNAFMIAEVAQAPQFEKDYVKTGKEFDATINYNFEAAMEDFFISNKPVKTDEFNKELLEMLFNYESHMPVTMNYTGSHTYRLASAVANPNLDGLHNYTNLLANNTLAPTAQQWVTMANIIAFQMTFVGAPVLNYGDEAGMWGAHNPDIHKPMVWQELTYDDEATHADQTPQTPQPVSLNKNIYKEYKDFIALRKKYEVFQRGDYNAFLMDDEHGLFAYERWLGQQHVIIVFNRSSTKQAISFEESMMRDKVKLEELFSHKIVEAYNYRFDVSVPAHWFQVYLARPAY